MTESHNLTNPLIFVNPFLIAKKRAKEIGKYEIIKTGVEKWQ